MITQLLMLKTREVSYVLTEFVSVRLKFNLIKYLKRKQKERIHAQESCFTGVPSISTKDTHLHVKSFHS